MVRFYIKPVEYKNKSIKFDSEQSKKIRKVLRLKVGDIVQAFDGKGWEYDAQLSKVTNEYSIANIIDQRLVESRSNIILVQALPKNLKIEFILQKCTELGVDRLIFFESDFSQVDAGKVRKEKVGRWRSIVEQSSEQSGRIFVPEVELFIGKVEELIVWAKETVKNVVVLDIEGEPSSSLENKIDKSNIALFVGPEGGFSSKEKALFSKYGIKKVKISENILRSETAGMAFLSQLY